MPGAIQPAHLDSREPASVSGFSEAEVSKTGFGLSALRLDFHNIILDKQKETGHRGPAPLYSYPETDLPSGISS